MDENFILTVIEKFNVSPAVELKLKDGTTRLVLRKERAACSRAEGTPEKPSGNGQATPIQAEAQDENPVRLGITANPEPAGNGEKITSPIVATFYASPSPDAPPFVTAGSKIKAGETLCILEAMKMMNHLEAEFDCEIIETHVSSGELVEYGQILFTVKKL